MRLSTKIKQLIKFCAWMTTTDGVRSRMSEMLERNGFLVVAAPEGYAPLCSCTNREYCGSPFSALKDHLNRLDFSLLSPDVMTVADEVEAQLTQSMDSHTGAMKSHAA